MSSREMLINSMKKIPTFRFHLVNNDGIASNKTNSFAEAVMIAYNERQLVYDSKMDCWIYDGRIDKIIT